MGFLLFLLFLSFVVWLVAHLLGSCTRPIQDIASLSPPWAQTNLPNVLCVALPISGRELFTPPLVAGRLYRLDFSGIYEVYEFRWLGRVPLGNAGLRTTADAVYYTDEHGNFARRYPGAMVDGVALSSGELDSFVEDRAAHNYSCLIEGAGERVFIKACPPPGGGIPDGCLWARLTVAAATDPAVIARQQAIAAAALAQAQQQQAAAMLIEQAEQAKAQAQAQRRQQRLNEQVSAQKIKVHQQRNLLDPVYRLHFVRKNQQQILSDWRRAWESEYEAITADSELVAALKAAAPEVLDWHEKRLEMIVSAERLETLPAVEPASLSTPLPLTSRTIPQAEYSVEMLFFLRQEHSKVREEQARGTGGSGSYWSKLDSIARLMAFHLDELGRFGILAATPEEAEARFQDLLPAPPVEVQPPTFYESLRQCLRAGEGVSTEPLLKQLEDLQREEIIMQARRRAAIRGGKDQLRENIDARLALVRREAAASKGALEAIGLKVELPEYREREISREDQFYKLIRERDNMTTALAAQGDPEGAEHLRALFAQELAKLFEADVEGYA